eukprot:CAMPEP_0185762514 /NCGR_PEP_ID=MMETSP1174-20130828/21477_1 /TAXON_ID=35687 /ORGANISM="Dictyocha speculum, Strain CCMP1381" /LENGTH=237 /DNA_ID=CAMNT_0028444219 /DNA_START=494 /DNA_END=1207 /DNA_ORIENTATION=+
MKVQETRPVEEEMDRIDDLSMNRPANIGRDKVKMWGVWLDADLVGRKAGKNQAAFLTDEVDDDTMAERIFSVGVTQMKLGEYAAAGGLFNRAVGLVGGSSSRRGGEIALWEAQAVHANGDVAAALRLLKGLEQHMDSSVGKVAGEIRYIFEAPKLEMDPDNMVKIPDLSRLDDWDSKRDMRFATQTTGGPVREFKKPPKKHSLEWVKEQRNEPPAEIDPVQFCLLLSLAVGSIFLFR